MRFKCRPSWWDRLWEWLDKRERAYYLMSPDWHDCFMFYGKVDEVCVFFETVERKLECDEGFYRFQDVWYWKYRLKEK